MLLISHEMHFVSACTCVAIAWAIVVYHASTSDHSSDLAHLGSVSASHATVWLFSLTATEARVSYTSEHNVWGVVTADFSDNDPTLTIALRDLVADTRYTVAIAFVNKSTNVTLRSTTLSLKTLATYMSTVRFAFGSCTMAVPLLHTITGFSGNLDYIATRLKPDFMLLLGDQIYADVDLAHNTELLYRTTVHDHQYATVGMSTPIFSIYDDHEIRNDWNEGPLDPLYLDRIQYYTRYFGNRNPESLENGEHYYTWSTGVAAFFMLDVRKYASPKAAPDGPTKTKLGVTQKQHLLRWLQASTEPFKVVISSMVVSDMGIQATGEGWARYGAEYHEIFDYVQAHNVSGVVLLSGDLHFAGVWQHSPYSFLYEVGASPISAFPVIPIHSVKSTHKTLFQSWTGLHFGHITIVDKSRSDGSPAMEIVMYQSRLGQPRPAFSMRLNWTNTIPKPWAMN
ncbi:hypothetical protein, variant 2 [Aphanomyces invadans]|uniref:PhoD-like phosphatase metallophosphatase domain-containing protein n=1 Tax=Aphanomyces invadans TaxID=157072 RepID=A0A024U514_9STRA|nr:hypothetical protein H310_06609 [Aphanomyces invadans]XP_008869961.1 hypothetical protein, variant 1 [Aphanomyces invadans]XP_008869962.1 hypothetical protein, variant 2 [Aphanomyces invadans]ETW00962.1 hypothetical protein H310_06609 [Aphanomyces invadans]ETW00963.1 hypothetical protein, variant 1 [Aphanomyces invadans]ETW00964.1 hypothetical protein, variant 2 [Aphanomyces invadans]|eukprot:XP_008869960.1 hypothetical protein H310_06609 [Aphanomyces invadans]